uniref:Leucine-rich repeats and calponin homology (CH) domain containing 3 n=1 Tax=Oreochromis niloticus TaxID=8128 RepID=I3KKY4_ORENI
MAASVLLGSADSAGLSFTVGGGGTGNSNGLGPAGPAPWNRSLDRALDEAAATGSLNLSGRKLKEFPRSAANHDLTDTTRADLSRNRLSELPLEVCLFVSLESLNLYQNCLRSLPDGLLNLQALTYLNLSRNQLSVLPPVVCGLPLKVLIACNNKLVSLPEELGQLRHLTELDVSCNEIQTLPAQVGQLEALRDLNIRRNHLVRLPPELAELPLVRLDFSCNKVTSIPVCYRRLTQLQTIVLDNNPLQTPPAQICIKGKVHIFKYLNLEASKTTPDLPEYDRRPLTFSSCVDELYPGRPYGALDSGFNSVDSGDKRWLSNEVTQTPDWCSSSGSSPPLCVCVCVCVCVSDGELEQIDFIDSCAGEEEEEEGRRSRGGGDRTSLSSQFMAYIERRITREVRAPPTGSHTCGSHAPHNCLSSFNYSPVGACPQPHSPVRCALCDCCSLSVLQVTPLLLRARRRPPPLLLLQARMSRWWSSSGRCVPGLTWGGLPCSQVTDRPSLSLQNIEARLKVSLPSDLGAALTDGVVLCHLANHVRPRSVPSIHVPSPAVPKLTMAKCRRNVENFLEACRRIGVPQDSLCSVGDVLEGKGGGVYATVEVLLSMAPPLVSLSPQVQLAGFALFYLSVMSVLCAIYVHLAPHV